MAAPASPSFLNDSHYSSHLDQLAALPDENQPIYGASDMLPPPSSFASSSPAGGHPSAALASAAAAATLSASSLALPRSTRMRRRFWLEFGVVPEESPLAPQDTPTFHQFRFLPPEIRVQIWELILHRPRVVTVTCQFEDRPVVARRPLIPLEGYGPEGASSPSFLPARRPLQPNDDAFSSSSTRTPPPPVPVLLRICRETYNLARPHYDLAFSWRLPYALFDDDVGPRPGGPGCWFQFARDIVLLQGQLEPRDDASSTSMAYFLQSADTSRVKHVACRAADLGVADLLAEQLFSRMFPIVDRFANVKQLVVLTEASSKEEAEAAAAGEAALGGSSGSGDAAASGVARESASSEAGKGKRVQATLAESSVVEEDTDIRPGNDSAEDNICQRVWDRWTAATNVAGGGGGGGSGGGASAVATGSSSAVAPRNPSVTYTTHARMSVPTVQLQPTDQLDANGERGNIFSFSWPRDVPLPAMLITQYPGEQHHNHDDGYEHHHHHQDGHHHDQHHDQYHHHGDDDDYYHHHDYHTGPDYDVNAIEEEDKLRIAMLPEDELVDYVVRTSRPHDKSRMRSCYLD